MRHFSRNIVSIIKHRAKSIPAYSLFLKKHQAHTLTIKTIDDIKKLPLTDKKNYILSNKLEDLFVKKAVPRTVYASSGSTGKSTFWFRGPEQELDGADLHERIFNKIFGIKKSESTLVIVTFSMGVWIAGSYTSASCQLLADRGYKISVVTPGMEKQDFFDILKRLAPKFDNVVLAGYPSFLMDVMNEATALGIKLKNKKIGIITAGDKFNEKWRTDFLALLKIKNPFNSLISIYGSADAGILGHETPLSIFVRRRAIDDENLYQDLFGNAGVLPGLVQYDPKYIFFETVEGELVITANSGTPLTRYNMHDVGEVIPYKVVIKLLKKYGMLAEAKKKGYLKWNYPFVVLKGRQDVAVTFYAINIYPENISQSLHDKSIAKYVSGDYVAFSKTLKKSTVEKLNIKVELSPKVKVSNTLKTKIQNSIVDNLTEVNIEYRKLHNTIGKRALPNIILESSGDKDFLKDVVTKMVAIDGKKPKMVKK